MSAGLFKPYTSFNGIEKWWLHLNNPFYTLQFSTFFWTNMQLKMLPPSGQGIHTHTVSRTVSGHKNENVGSRIGVLLEDAFFLKTSKEL